MTLGHGQEITLTFNTNLPSFTQHLLTLRSQTAILFKKSTVFTFSYRKAYVTKFDLAVNYVKVTLGSSFEQTMMGWMLHTKFRGNWTIGSGEDF